MLTWPGMQSSLPPKIVKCLLFFPLLLVYCCSRLGWRRGTAEGSLVMLADSALCGAGFQILSCYGRTPRNLQLHSSLSLNNVCDQTSLPCTPHPPPTTAVVYTWRNHGGTAACSVETSLTCCFSPSLSSIFSNEHRRQSTIYYIKNVQRRLGGSVS